MNATEAKLVEGILTAIIGLFPGGATAKDFAGPLLARLLASRDDKSIESRLKQRAEEIAGYLVALERAGHTNRGSGYAARIDFLAIMGKIQLTPSRLIELGLDREQLIAYLEEVGKEELAEASRGRRGRVRDALRQFADAVLETAPDMPAVRLEFMKAVLRKGKD